MEPITGGQDRWTDRETDGQTGIWHVMRPVRRSTNVTMVPVRSVVAERVVTAVIHCQHVFDRHEGRLYPSERSKRTRWENAASGETDIGPAAAAGRNQHRADQSVTRLSSLPEASRYWRNCLVSKLLEMCAKKDRRNKAQRQATTAQRAVVDVQRHRESRTEDVGGRQSRTRSGCGWSRSLCCCCEEDLVSGKSSALSQVRCKDEGIVSPGFCWAMSAACERLVRRVWHSYTPPRYALCVMVDLTCCGRFSKKVLCVMVGSIWCSVASCMFS